MLHYFIATKQAFDAHHSGTPRVERRSKPRSHVKLGETDPVSGKVETQELRDAREAYHKNDTKHFAGIDVGHFIELSDGRILLAASFNNQKAHDSFEAFSGVIPFPYVRSNKQIGSVISGIIAPLGFGVLETDTSFDAALKISKHVPDFDPRRF